VVLAELRIEDLRCIERAELSFCSGTNLIYGANGAGKTSILEAIFLLGRGRSFRTRLNERLIRHGQPLFRVIGQTCSTSRLSHNIGIEVSRDATTLARLDGQNTRSFAELALAFPIQALDPDTHKLIEDSSARRRRWLDWLVFHVEHSFAQAWTRYQRALSQRNAALRSGLNDIAGWDLELAKQGEVMTAARAQVLLALQPYWRDLSENLLGVELSVIFQAGWDRSMSLSDALASNSSRDRDRRTTTVGPHRADVALRIEGKAAREVLSRGQQKLAAIALSLCQLEYLKSEHGLVPSLLLDDPSAELDQNRLGRFIRRVQTLETQIIVTALDRNYRLFGEPKNVFHVEQGKVYRL